MFETSVVRAEATALERRVSLVTLSLFAHSAVIVGAIVISVATVEFPENAPDEYRMAPLFAQVRIPPPEGTADGGRRPAQRAAQPPLPASRTELTAPQTVPEEVTPAGAGETVTGDATASPGTGDGPLGVEGGTPGSIGDLDAPIGSGPIAPVEEKIYHPGGEVVAPVLVRKVEPVYPPLMVRTRMKATVVVRCVIDRTGRVRDPQILSNTLPPFNQSVIQAVQQWQFRPGSLRGQPVDTYLDLTVNFAVAR